MSNQKHVTELIPAYAVSCLDVAESLQVARHLASCAACQAELSRYEAVVDQLSLAVPEAEPTVDLKARLLDQIERPSVEPAAATTAVSRPHWWPPVWWPKVRSLAGPAWWRPAVALLLLLLLVSNLFLWHQLNRALLTANDFQYILLEATEASPGARGLIVVNESGQSGTMIVDGLPLLDDSQQYQLWLLGNGEREDGGVFSVYRSGYYAMLIHAPESLDQYTGFGITIEPVGGSPGPTGARVLGSQ
jgi:anti-sigma-K factor RskA